MDVMGAVVRDVVTGAVGSLISKLGELLKEEYMLQKRAPEKLLSLIKELECARAALRKVDGVPPDQLEEQVRIWAYEIRDASYDMEDEIDTFLMEVDGRCDDEHPADQESLFQRLHHYVGGLFSMVGILFKRRKIDVAIDGIIKRLEDVTQRHDRYRLDGITVRPAATSTVDPRLAAMYNEVTQLVGIGKSSNDLIAVVKKMNMVSVVGVGGLGKTTLVKSVYDKLKVDSDLKFECWAFIPIGRNPDLKKVFKDILIEIDKGKSMDPNLSMLDERQLINELRERLRNKRYLLVIDDIWEIKSWEIIKLALSQEKKKSRVITTTRILEVARKTGDVYKLQHLPYYESKKLFYMRLFGTVDTYLDNELDEISDKIIKKCDGIPLAIITMASLLVGKSREQWIEVCSSIAFRDKDNKQVTDTEWILSLSYYDLPPHLRTCLLYLSVFPEDHLIYKDSLIWMWVAEGFVHKDKPGTWLYEVGTKYFNELVNKCMIQEVQSEEEDHETIVGCRVHDMMLDFLRLKSQEENFVAIFNNDAQATSSEGTVRRIAHQNQNKIVEQTQMDPTHLRSFIATDCSFGHRLSFMSFKLLRVLSLEGCSGECGKKFCLEHVDKLLHLRYLGLRYSRIHNIPKDIGCLKFLQTLDLEVIYFRKVILPTSVGLLTQLICLRTGWMRVPEGVIEKLIYLEQLEIRVYEDWMGHFVKELGKLHELRILCLELLLNNYVDEIDDRVERDLVESLGNLHKIQQLKLELSCVVQFEKTVVLQQSIRQLIVPDIYFPELPWCISPSNLPNLTHLHLCVDFVEDQHLRNLLGQLPELRHLILHIGDTYNAAKVTLTSTGCFNNLRSLSLPFSAVQFMLHEDSSVSFIVGNRITDFTATKKRDKCIAAPAVMPNLQRLEFMVQLKNESSNLVLGCLPSLQKVRITLWCYDVARLFADDVKREEAALRQAIEGHPNRPELQLILEGTSCPMRRPAEDVRAEGGGPSTSGSSH